MISGIGNDIIEIARIASVLSRRGQSFLDRVFVKVEQEYCLEHRHPEQHLAGRFAAKEAVSKALGTGIGKDVGWHDIVITTLPSGKPVVTLSEHIHQAFGPLEVLITISHCKEYASAVAVIQCIASKSS